MKQYQPDYYDKFQCISSQCPMTCCMQWRIAVDDETLEQWDADRKKQVKEVEEGHIIELKQDGHNSSPIKEILRKLHIQSSGFSKYCIGSALTVSHLKCNRLKPKLRMLNKMGVY